QAGERSEILATASSYGKKLAQRSAQGKTLSFDELRNARWGILEAGNNAGNRYPALYLADHYAGNTLADLDSVTVYASYEELLRAAAEKTVDIVPLPARILTENAALWQRERSHSDDGGRSGFGQENGIFEDLRSLGETEPVYRAVALVPEDCGEALSSALFSALGRLSETAEGREMLARTGAERYAQVMPDALDGMKRALSLEGES
ncbi:MAG: PhnD/SsuA/transferrin family substrate-binding protein, partial [Ruthenibacterium sp.]